MKTIIFYFPVSDKIGYGHLVRCTALAKLYKKNHFKCILVTNNIKSLKLIDQKIFSKIFKLNWVNEKYNSKKIVDIYSSFNADYLVVDDARAKVFFQKHLLSQKIKWLQFQNSMNVNFYSNQLIYQNNFKTRTNIAKSQKIYSGQDYIILRPEFYAKRKIFGKSIFVCFGGCSNLIIYKTILEILLDIGTVSKIKILVNNNVVLKKLKTFKNKYGNRINIKLFLSSKNVKKIIDRCNLSITSSGMISHEVNSRGIKMILFAIAKNQTKLAKYWKKKGHFYLGEFDKKNYEQYKKKIKKVISLDKKIYKIKYANKIKNIIEDTKKIISDIKNPNKFEIENTYNKEKIPILHTKNLKLIPISKENFKNLHQIRKSILRENKKFFKNFKVISNKDHENWFKNYYSKNRIDSLIFHKKDKIYIGALHFKKNFKKIEIGKFISNPKYRNKNFAFEATKKWLDYAKKNLICDKLLAITSKNNIPNIKLNEKLGFKLINNYNRKLKWLRMHYQLR